MLVSGTFGLSETSERTLEFNVLNEFAAYLWSNFGLTVTVISPTQVDENRLGFDDIVEGLPPGQLLAFQFKRPKGMIDPADTVRFRLDTGQLQRLAARFSRNQAYIVLPPFTRNQQVVDHRRRLLTMARAVDIYDIPNLHKTSQKTRTVRVHTHHTLSGSPPIEIADPRKYEAIKKVLSVAEIGKLVSTNDVGYKITGKKIDFGDMKLDQPRKIGVRKLFYVHVSKLPD